MPRQRVQEYGLEIVCRLPMSMIVLYMPSNMGLRMAASPLRMCPEREPVTISACILQTMKHTLPFR